MSENIKIFRFSHNMNGEVNDFSEAMNIADRYAESMNSLIDAKKRILKQSEQSVINRTARVKLGDASFEPDMEGITGFMSAMPDAMADTTYTLYKGTASDGTEYKITLETRRVNDGLENDGSSLTAYICLIRKYVPESSEHFVLDDNGEWEQLVPQTTGDVIYDVARLLLKNDHDVTDREWYTFMHEQKPLLDLAKRTEEFMTLDYIHGRMFIIPLDPDSFGMAIGFRTKDDVFEIYQYVSTDGKYNICIDISDDDYSPDTDYMKKVAETDDADAVENLLASTFNRYTNGHALLAIPYNTREAIVATIDNGITGDTVKELARCAEGTAEETAHISELAYQIDKWREESMLEDEYIGTEPETDWSVEPVRVIN